jgi:hypothetical protein
MATKLVPFKRTYRKSDFGLIADVLLIQNKYTEIGSLKVPAQQELAYGSNESVSGRIQGAPAYINIYDTSAQLSGVVRLVMSNANETETKVIMEESIERLSSDISDRTKAVLFPETKIRVKEDSKLKILFKADDTGKTIDFNAANTKFSIPVTVYQ